MNDRWHPTHGRKPKLDEPLQVRFRNGKIGRQPYRPPQMQWGHHRPGMEDDYDIIDVRRTT